MSPFLKSALTWLTVLVGVSLVFAGRYVWVQAG